MFTGASEIRRTSSGRNKNNITAHPNSTNSSLSPSSSNTSKQSLSMSNSNNTTNNNNDLNKILSVHPSTISEESSSINSDSTRMNVINANNTSIDNSINDDKGDENDMKPLLVEKGNSHTNTSKNGGGSDGGANTAIDIFFATYCSSNPEFFKNAFKLSFAFLGLQISYLTWGYMQELIMTTTFNPTPRVPDGRFPSAAFAVFSNRFLAVIIALIAVRIRHGAFFANNKAPLISFTPCALSNTMSSWSQYASLRYVSFPVQTVFKSSKIIPVMIMGKVLKGTQYPMKQYVEAGLITVGVAVFSILSKSKSGKEDATTELVGLVFLLMYVFFDSFTSQWQDKVYQQYGRQNVDPYQMMLGVNVSAICITTAGLIVSGDIPIVYEFLQANPDVVTYNIITAITSASGQLCIFYTIKEFGPIVFTIIMTTRQMLSICLSAVIFGHVIKPGAICGAVVVFGVLFYQIYSKYKSKNKK